MPKQRFALEEGAEKNVELEWRGRWKDFTVRVEGRELGRLDGEEDLARGGAWKLDDGSLLQVLLDRSGSGYELLLTRNGVPLPGSASDPKARLAQAWGILAFLGGLNLILGGVAELLQNRWLLDMGMGWGSVVFGVVFLALALAVRKGSRIALIVAIVLFALDALLGVYFVMEAGGRPGIGGIVFRVFLLAALIKAVGAAKPEHGAP